MTTALRVALRGVVVLALCLMGSAFAQDAFPQAGDRPETSLAERIDRLVARLEATRGRMAPPIDAVDVTDAEAWLEASPLERLIERAAARTATEAEQALWNQAGRARRALDRRAPRAQRRAHAAARARARCRAAFRGRDRRVARGYGRGRRDAEPDPCRAAGARILCRDRGRPDAHARGRARTARGQRSDRRGRNAVSRGAAAPPCARRLRRGARRGRAGDRASATARDSAARGRTSRDDRTDRERCREPGLGDAARSRA